MEKTVYITGSFKMHYEGIAQTIAEFERMGFYVLSPKGLVIPATLNDLSYMLRRDKGEIQKSSTNDMSDAIRKSNVFYVFNPGGYADTKVSIEMGFALGFGKQIFVKEPMANATLSEFSTVATLDSIMGLVKTDSLKPAFTQKWT